MEIQNRLYSPRELIVANGGPLPLSISAVYAAIRRGEIPVVKIGHRKMVPSWFLEKLLAGNQEAAS